MWVLHLFPSLHWTILSLSASLMNQLKHHTQATAFIKRGTDTVLLWHHQGCVQTADVECGSTRVSVAPHLFKSFFRSLNSFIVGRGLNTKINLVVITLTLAVIINMFLKMYFMFLLLTLYIELLRITMFSFERATCSWTMWPLGYHMVSQTSHLWTPTLQAVFILCFLSSFLLSTFFQTTTWFWNTLQSTIALTFFWSAQEKMICWNTCSRTGWTEGLAGWTVTSDLWPVWRWDIKTWLE